MTRLIRPNFSRPLVIGTTAMAVAMALLAAGLPGESAAQPAPGGTDDCAIAHDMTVAPRFVAAGGAVTVTAHASALCDTPEFPRHVVLVLDATSSMAGEPMDALEEAVREFIRGIGLSAGSPTRIGIVQYDGVASTLCTLTDDEAALAACVDRLAVRPGTSGASISAGIQEGLHVMVTGRRDIESAASVREIMIVLTDGSDNAGCGAVETAAKNASSQRILVVTACLGPGCDVACMRSTASSPRYYFMARSHSELPALFSQLVGSIFRMPIDLRGPTALVLAIRPAPGMRLVDGSQSPGAPFLDADGLGWHFPDPPREGVTITFRVEPTVAGDLPVLSSAVGAYSHRGEDLVAFAFDVPRVVVVSGGALATETPGSPGPLAMVAHALALDPERPVPGEASRMSYRLAFADPVQPQGSHVAVVVDASGSMAGDANVGLKAALRSLVAGLPLGVDPSARVGLVAFNSAAWLLSDLTDRRQAIDAAIGVIGASGGTCIQCGIEAGHRALIEARPAPGVEDLVVFTDGANNQGCAGVLGAADAAKAEGVVVHTVCMLPGCDTECMAAAASPGRYHEVPRLDALGGAFSGVGTALAADRRIEGLDLTLVLPPHLALVPGSAVPAPSDARDPAAVSWQFGSVPRTGIHVAAELAARLHGAEGPVMMAEATLRDGTKQRAVVEAFLGAGFEPTVAPDPATPTAPSTVSPRYALHLPWSMR